LLLDDFRGDKSELYENGFPWHPHRGIETVTYMLDGTVEHSDSLGNKDTIGPGDIQWMTAGSGILHQEMPKGDNNGIMGGFQLWVNLPAKHKMTDPKYRDIKAGQIPVADLENGVKIKIVSGNVENTNGVVEDCFTETEFIDIEMPADTEYFHPINKDFNSFAYVIDGSVNFGEENYKISNTELVQFDSGDTIKISTGEKSGRLLLISGKPLNEPVAWRGPIVMNTEEELRKAFKDYHSGTFIKNNS